MRTYAQLGIQNLDMRFSTAYIDGSHVNDMPLWDWLLVKNMVSKYVIFDNWSDRFPDVQIACEQANNDPEWRCVYSKGITYIVERI